MTFAGNASLKLALDVFRACLFERIGATADRNRDCDRAQDRPGFHPLILGSKSGKATDRINRIYRDATITGPILEILSIL